MIRFLSVAIFSSLAISSSAAHADVLFFEDFGTLSDGTNVTTGNTDFDYVRVGSGGGSITIENPGQFSGASMLLGGSSSTSLNGVGVSSGLGNRDFLSLSLDLRSADMALGDLVITTGTGATFGNNSQFNSAHLFFGVQVNNGNLEVRSPGEWDSVGFSFQNDTNYRLEIFGNSTGGTVDYGGGTVADGRLDIVVDGVTVADDVLFQDSITADAFRIYQVNGGQFYEIDNVSLTNNFTAVPEPASIGILCALGGGFLVRRRYLSKKKNADEDIAKA